MSPNHNHSDFLQHLAEHTHQIVFCFDISTRRFTYLNNAFEEVWQQSRAGAMEDAAALLDRVHPDDRAYVADAFSAQLQGENQQGVEFQVLRPDASVRWLSLSSYRLHTQSPAIAGFAEDVTDRKHHAETLHKYAAKKNSVLEILSHDLARPLANIQGLSSMLARQLEHMDDEKLNRTVEMIADTSRRGITLIREFVQQEFLESASVELIRKRVNLVQKMQELMEQYQGSQDDIGKTFHLLTDQEDIYCEIDDVKFMQVMNNLISNAIKFTTDEGVITVRLEDQGGKILVTVEDNGIGIPADLQEGLFEKFPKARRPGLKGEPSVGLGMSVIKTIVEWHKGEIWFESEENKGTAFHIQIPKE